MDETVEEKPLHIQFIVLKEGMEKNVRKFPFTILLIKKFRKLTFNKPVAYDFNLDMTGQSQITMKPGGLTNRRKNRQKALDAKNKSIANE